MFSYKNSRLPLCSLILNSVVLLRTTTVYEQLQLQSNSIIVQISNNSRGCRSHHPRHCSKADHKFKVSVRDSSSENRSKGLWLLTPTPAGKNKRSNQYQELTESHGCHLHDYNDSHSKSSNSRRSSYTDPLSLSPSEFSL